MTINTTIILLSFVGFLVSFYIYKSRKQNKKMVCLIGKDCDLVLDSKYNSFAGIPNEVIGIFYYSLILIYTILISYLPIFSQSIDNYVLLINFFAGLYSFGLIFIQAFILKEWCEYCLVSAGISILIFFLKLTPILALY